MKAIDSYNNAAGNLEVETKIAQYMYLSKLPEFTNSSKWANKWSSDKFQRYAANLAERLTDNGELKPHIDEFKYNNKFVEVANSIYQQNSIYKVDRSRSLSQNIKNLNELSEGC